MAMTSSTASRSPDLADDPAKLLAARLACNRLVETPQPCRRRRSRASSYRKSPSRRPCSLPRRQDDAAELKPLPGATTTSRTASTRKPSRRSTPTPRAGEQRRSRTANTPSLCHHTTASPCSFASPSPPTSPMVNNEYHGDSQPADQVKWPFFFTKIKAEIHSNQEL